MSNSCTMLGRLVADPEEIQHKGNDTFVSFRIAVDRPYEDKTDFFSCTVWGRTADNILKYMSKGRLIFITGNVIIEEFQDRDGNDRREPKVRVRSFSFVNDGSRNSDDNSSKNNSSNSSNEEEIEDDFDDEFDDEDDSDFSVPF